MSTPTTFRDWIGERRQQIEAAGLLRTRRVVEPLGNGRCRLENSEELWDFSSNDYLGLSGHPGVVAATCSAIERYGVGARASLLISGWSPVHQALREKLSRFLQTEDAALFSSGYAACMGTVSALVEKTDTVFCDKLNHACLVDGCRLAGARLRVFRHDDFRTLARELEKSATTINSGRRWIVTESLFGMDGAPADLAEIVRLAEQFDAWIICDEAHATGIYGPGGRGLVAELLQREPDVKKTAENRIVARLGTFSKSFGSQGGFVIGSAALVELLWNTARPAMFSTGLSIANCAAAGQAIEILQENPEFPAQLRESSRCFREQLQHSGLKLLGAADCPIVPLVIEDPRETIEWARRLRESGFLVGAVRPPTVPHNSSRLRISLNRLHPPAALEQLSQTLAQLQQRELTQ